MTGNIISPISYHAEYGYGILAQFSNSLEIRTNTITSGSHGIYFSGCSSSIIANNTVGSFWSGIVLSNFWGYYFSNDNLIYNNNIFSSVGAINEGSNNAFNLSAPIGGNYWVNFDKPEEGCNDLNTDGFCDLPFYFAGGVHYLPWTKQDGWQIISATIDVKPDTLNRKSKGGKNSVTVYIELPDADIQQIDASTIILSTNMGSISSRLSPIEISDYNGNGIPDVMVKFDRQEVIAIVDIGDNIKIEISGSIAGKIFKGEDIIRVINN